MPLQQKKIHDSETPAEGKQVITACAFIHHPFAGIEKVFLPKRADTKKFLPGVYELPGGHIDFGEDIVAGLRREIQEEFAMAIQIGDPFACFTYTNNVKGSHSVEVIFFAQFIDSLENIRIHPEDHSLFDWIGEDDLKKVGTINRQGDDPEIRAMKKGFSILAGRPPTV